MAAPVAARQTAQAQRTDPQRAAARPARQAAMPARAGIDRLQRALGNRGMYHLLRSGAIQAKLAVGPADDEYEREADRVADEVIRMPDLTSTVTAQRSTLRVQRVYPECEEDAQRSPLQECEELQQKSSATTLSGPEQISRKCPECEEKARRQTQEGDAVQRKSDPTDEKDEEEEGIVQAKSRGGDPPEPSSELTSYVASSRGGGQPLPRSTREHFEARFGHDFSGVRVHTGSRSANAAAEINSYAFTTGADIHFGSGRFQPGTRQGDRLLAHELTHVIQQDRSRDVRLQRRFACTSGTLTDTRCADTQGAGHPPGVNLEHFDEEKHGLKPPHLAQITAFKSTWTAAGVRDAVEVHGYASCDGDANFNVQLSCARAEAVKAELVARGITTTITTFAHGETDEFGASLDANRRVILKTVAPPPPTPPPPSPPVPVTSTCTVPTNPDLSGRASNPTTSGETAVCVLNPLDCSDAFDCRDVAFAAAIASGLSGAHLGPQDAFRHCVWSCCMAQTMGAAEAEEFGTAHENSNPSSIPFDNQMDLHDNATGRSLATPGADCTAECRAAVTSGRLRTIRGPQADRSASSEGLSPAAPPVPTACIGASDQSWP